MTRIVEQDIEDAAIEILEKDLGYSYIHGPEIAPDSENPERKSFDEVILENKLKESLERINPKIPESAIEEAIKQVQRIKNKEFLVGNQKFHKILTEGLAVKYRSEGRIKDDLLWLVDFENPENNDFLVVNQLAILEDEKHRRPDLVVFVNGLPLALIELKNPFATDENKLDSAFKQIQTYKQEIPSIFNYNEILIYSDGTFANIGTITSSKEWFLPWKSIRGEDPSKNRAMPQLQVALEGMFKKQNLLDIIRHFITFDKSGKNPEKILAGYHQYHATNKAVSETLDAIKEDGRIGVVWHTQGSGKSLTMAFYTSKISVQPELNNPTLVLLTDRNDLDDQLFQTFSANSILRETPIQVTSKEELRNELKKRASGGVIFATIQKFGLDKEGKTELLSERKNIIVAADEAHRSQYGFSAKVKDGEMKYGLAKYMRDALPNACFIGFTGTPIDFKDKSTRSVFGKYIDIYDIERAVEDERTVRIYYEPRLIRVGLNKKELDKEVDDLLKEGIPGEEEEVLYQKQKVKSKWARVESIIGSEKRLNALAKEIISHFEKRQESFEGKAMVVCMSRKICVALHNKIAKLKPEWINKDDKKGLMKIIMTGSAEDGPEWQEHIRTKEKRRAMGKLFKKPDSDFKLAIVRDMWLTGFDVPCLNTLYLDKPMKGHGLMQAIARVNRVYKEKEGGLIVDFLGIGSELKYALKDYSANGGKGKPAYDKQEAISLMLEKYDVVRSILHGFDYMKFFKQGPKERMQVVPATMNYILSLDKGKERFAKQVGLLLGAFALASPSEEASKITDEVALFQAIKNAFTRIETSGRDGKSPEELDTALKQIVSEAITSKGVIDIFKSLDMEKPEISVLSEEFLESVQKVEYKNLAFEALRKLLEDEIRIKFKRNIIKSKKFSEMLNEALNKYKNRSIDSAQIVKELVDIARRVREDKSEGKKLNLSREEEAFYDALTDNGSAKDILGDKVLAEIAKKLTELIKANASIDWEIRESVQAKLKVMIKRLLREYGYPPDKEKMATELVLKQAEGFAEDWSSER
jgi:type I restriction enzyme, R subunit